MRIRLSEASSVGACRSNSRRTVRSGESCEACFDYVYDPKATCPRWEQFLSEMFAGDRERIEFVREFFAYCVTGDSSQQVSLLVIGSGGNGKKVLLDTLQGLVGEENCSAVALEDFKSEFHLSETIGKSLNVVNEIGDVQKLPEGKLKAFVSPDRMSFNRKHRDPISVIPTARLVFAGNEVPRFMDRSEGIWRRLIILPCDVVIPEEKQDKQLPEKMRSELAGIFNWAMTGAASLRQRGRFAVPSAAKLAAASHREASNPARRFLREYCVADSAGTVSTDHLLGVHQEWCRAIRVAPLDDSQFGKEVIAVFPTVVKRRPTSGGGVRVPTYFGIRLDRMPQIDAVYLQIQEDEMKK